MTRLRAIPSVARTLRSTPAPPADAGAKGRNLWRVYLALGLVAAVVYFLVPRGLPHHVIYDALGLSSVAMIWYGIRWHRPPVPQPWRLFALGQLGFVIGDGIRAFYESVLQVESPFPGPADAAYIAAYPILTVGLMLLVRSRDAAKDRANVIDAMIIVTSAGLLFWVYLVEPQIHVEGVGTLGISISMAYPLMDLLLLAVAARLMFSPGARSTSYYLLCGSLLALLTADTLYTGALLSGSYQTGDLLDAGWLVSYLLWGAAALHPSMTEMSRPVAERQLKVSRGRLGLLAGASLLAPSVRIFETVRGDDLPPFTTVIPTVILFILVMVRMSGLVGMLSSALERHREAERRRRESEERFGSLVEHASDVVTVIDGDAVVTFQSPSVMRVLGYGRQELIGRPITDLIHSEDLATTLAIMDEVAANPSDEPASVQFRCRHRDGSWRDMEVTLTGLLHDPTVAGIVLNARDVTEQTALQEQLAHQAFHDPLTDLANRALFRDRVEHTLDRRSASDEAIAVLFLDVDDFKTINDSLGHSSGDQLLIELAARLQRCLRAGDTAARLGGDEFAILLEDTRQAEAVANRIGEALAAPFVLQRKEVFVTVSIGISISEAARGGADELLRDADAAMYAAKSRGKARSVAFRPDMHVRALKRLDVEAELRRAVERGEFRLHYQPLVQVRSGRLSGFEALIRWAHPGRGLVGPVEFIAIAEETGLIRPIGRWVVHEAARQAGIWRDKHPHERLTMSVNVTAQELAAKELGAEIRRALADSSLDPGTLTLEMTERALMADTELTMVKLEDLRRLGVRLAIDDFGTGFSSLSYLRSFPIDSLKIAKPFIDGIPEGEQETALVRGILELGHNLDLELVAEGVERPEQYQALEAMGFDLAQGYLLGRPQGPERIEKLLVGGAALAKERAEAFALPSPRELIEPAGA